MASVSMELSDLLFLELRKMHHHPGHGPIPLGFLCGGSFPLRAATALMLLALQKKELLNCGITYTNEEFKPMKRYLKGRFYQSMVNPDARGK